MLSPRPPPLSRVPGLVRGGGDEAAYWARLRYRGLLQDYKELLKETEAKKRRLHMMKLMKQRLLAEVRFLRKRYKSMSENPSQTIVCRVNNRSMPQPTATGRTAWGVDVEHPSVHAIGSSSKSMPVQRRQLGPPRASPVIDLNEACEPSHEMEMVGYHGFPEPPGINNHGFPEPRGISNYGFPEPRGISNHGFLEPRGISNHGFLEPQGINNHGFPEPQGINIHGFPEPQDISNPKRYPLEGDVAVGPCGMRMPLFWDIHNPVERAGKRKISYQDQLLLGV